MESEEAHGNGFLSALNGYKRNEDPVEDNKDILENNINWLVARDVFFSLLAEMFGILECSV